MAEHVTSLCERILRESSEHIIAPLDDVALTVRMRPRIEGWYNDRAFLAEQAKLLWERLDTATEEVKRLRAENADLLIALQVHNGKLAGTSKALREAVVRGVTLCVAALAKIVTKPTEET